MTGLPVPSKRYALFKQKTLATESIKDRRIKFPLKNRRKYSKNYLQLRLWVATAGAHTLVDEVLSCPSTFPILAKFPAIMFAGVLFDWPSRVQVPKILSHQLRRQLGTRGGREEGGYCDWIRGRVCMYTAPQSLWWSSLPFAKIDSWNINLKNTLIQTVFWTSVLFHCLYVSNSLI